MKHQQCLLFMLVVCCSVVTLSAQTTDSLSVIRLREVSVVGASIPRSSLAAQTSVYVSSDEMHRRAGHSLMDALAQTEGVQAMDIGVGFSKPMIRGLGFQRIVVTENGVKQEGQQWGADHGLEIDAFHVDGVRVVKGPASALYGSDAMGGVIEILPPSVPLRDTVSGEAIVSFQSVSMGVNASVMLQMKRRNVFAKVRFTERHWADYRVPADSFTYLSMRLPIHDNRLKNTAGMERSINTLLAYRRNGYQGRVNVSNSYQKSGFFSGAHGMPSSATLQDDGSRWNIDLPYSLVDHLKITSTNTWSGSLLQTKLTMGYQLNHREEWSLFHTHNISQAPPAVDPDKELMFRLHTGSSQLQWRLTPDTSWELYGGVSAMIQHNAVGGYGFLMPSYNRHEGGVYLLANYRHSSVLQLSGSLRCDVGHVSSERHGDDVGAVDRTFRDYSMSWGVEYKPNNTDVLQASVGRAFRLPSVNELTSNGVHHGAFRHEVGDSSLVGECGWQVDLSYSLRRDHVRLSLSPFYSYYSHFIALQPTGRWSMLPDAGQIYQYVDAPTTFVGGEVSLKAQLWRCLHYSLTGEYVYTFDHHSHTATPYSPPASMHNTLSWEASRWRCYAECQSVAAQRRVCHNEMVTNGYNIFNIGGSVDVALQGRMLSFMINVRNLFDTSYLNHLSFYRRIELPEAGVDIQTTIRLNF